MHFEIIGKSSGSKKTIEISEIDYHKKLLDFLRENNLPIASSCRGEKVCRLCRVNRDILSCSHTVKQFYDQYGATINIDYL